MLDIHRRKPAAANIPSTLEFLRIELAPLIDGEVLVSLTATRSHSSSIKKLHAYASRPLRSCSR